MKKILVLIGAILISAGSTFASQCNFECPGNPYAFSYSISNFTGTNFLAERIANMLIKKQILKESQGKYKVNLQSYNVSALKDGIFKSLEITGTDTITNGVYASSVKFKTLCDYNYIEINNKENTATFKEAFGMAFAIQFSEDDLNETMENSAYKEMIRRVNNIGNASKMFNISSSSIKIEDNKLVYIIKVAVPLLNIKKELEVETSLKAHNGEIVIDKAELNTEYFKIDVDKLSNLINYLNPLDFSLELMKNKDANMHVKDVVIKDDKINVRGLITIDKDVVTEQ